MFLVVTLLFVLLVTAVPVLVDRRWPERMKQIARRIVR